MTAIPITSRSQWQALRAADIVTASTVAALFPDVEHPFCSRDQLIARALADGAETTPDNKYMRRGRIAEPAAMEAMREDLGLEVWKAEFYYRHPTLPFGASPDCFIQDGEHAAFGCAQIKTVNQYRFKKEWDAGPPTWVLLQHQAEYLLTGCTWGGVAALVMSADLPLAWAPVEPHEGVMARIEELVAEFAAEVDTLKREHHRQGEAA